MVFCGTYTCISKNRVSVLDEGRIVHNGVLTYPDASTTMLVEIPSNTETQIQVSVNASNI